MLFASIFVLVFIFCSELVLVPVASLRVQAIRSCIVIAFTGIAIGIAIGIVLTIEAIDIRAPAILQVILRTTIKITRFF